MALSELDQPYIRHHAVIPPKAEPPVAGEEDPFSTAAEDYRSLENQRAGALQRILHPGIIFPVSPFGPGKKDLILVIAVI